MDISLKLIRERLSRYPSLDLPDSARLSHSAVALILRETGTGAEILMVRRAEHPKDPWSGHMAFPGGRVDPVDASPERAAVRETLEEIGVDLDRRARRIGRLAELRARSRFREMAMSIYPFIYEIAGPVEFTLNHEMVEALWIPIGFFLDEGQRVEMEHVDGDIARVLPCYRLENRVIWGLSLLMLDELLFEVLAKSPPERS